MKIAVDIGDRGNVDDRSPACALPDLDERVDQPEDRHVRVCQPVLLVKTEPAQNHRKSTGGGEEFARQRCDNDRGYEVRHVGCDLHCSGEPLDPQLRDKHCQNDRSGKAYGQVQECHCSGVAKHFEERIAREQILEVVKPYPLAAEKTFCRLILFERHQKADHRSIVEDNEVRKDRNEQHIQLPVAPEIVPP